MDRNFDIHIGFYIQETARILTRVHNDMLDYYGISFAQFRLLNCLWEQDGLNQSEILDVLHIKPSSLSTMITLLEKKKLIRRQVDREDTRSRRIFLTEDGKRLKGLSWEIIESLETVLRDPFSAAEKELFLEWLRRVRNSIQDKEETMKKRE